MKMFFWIAVGISSTVLFWINLQFPHFIEGIYQNQNFELLNQWAGAQVQEPLGYYVGRIEDVFVGPLTSVVTYVLFAFFCLLYLEKVSGKQFALAVFFFLLITKFSILLYPPYGDAIGGPFAEAIWLAENNFNYAGLIKQPAYHFAGPRVYFFSIYPSYLALLLKLIPSTQIFLIVNHIFVYMMTAVITALIRQIVRMRFDSKIASLSSLVILALPIFQSQTEAINMEIPCLFFSVWTVYFLCHKRLGEAVVMAVLSLAVKGYGIILCGSVFFVSLFLFCTQRHKRALWYALLVPIFPVLITAGKFLLKDQHATAGMMGFLNGLPSLQIMYLSKLYLISLGVFFGTLFWQHRVLQSIIKSLTDKFYPQLVVFVTAGMWFVLFINYTEVSPRYKLALAPYLVLCLIFSVFNFSWIKKWATFFLIGAIALTALGSHGFYHFPLNPNYHIFSERSLEYRNDLKLNQQLAKVVDTQYFDYKIGAPFIIAQMLAFPQLGYVENDLDVMVYGILSKYDQLDNVTITKKKMRKTVWIAVAAEMKKNEAFPIGPKDYVVAEFSQGENRATLFMGGVAIVQKMNQIYRQILGGNR
ncbi:hypothetical protein MNBD_UNCLBAC01-1554 [hydrothermal vent metagenome]|uniref:Glycosyltransferase RgtA/B/C/D-like domain-containing protein n=1 Tax=hydrothermal vent metagenome TaxID=652676 RepID=A0A3B1D2A7_9ZZZZ